MTMGKKNTSIWIEEEYVEELKRNNLKLSDTVNDFLKSYVEILNSSEKELFKKRQEITDLIHNKQLELDVITKRLFELSNDEEES